MDRRDVLRRSVEARVYRRSLLTVTWVYAGLMAVTLVSLAVSLRAFPEYAVRTEILYMGGFTLWYVPCAVYFGYNYFGLLRCAERVIFREQELDGFRMGAFSTARFTLTFPDGRGGTVRTETRAIYNTNMKRPRFEDYYQKRVTAVWDPVTGRTAVLEPGDYGEWIGKDYEA